MFTLIMIQNTVLAAATRPTENIFFLQTYTNALTFLETHFISEVKIQSVGRCG